MSQLSSGIDGAELLVDLLLECHQVLSSQIGTLIRLAIRWVRLYIAVARRWFIQIGQTKVAKFGRPNEWQDVGGVHVHGG